MTIKGTKRIYKRNTQNDLARQKGGTNIELGTLVPGNFIYNTVVPYSMLDFSAGQPQVPPATQVPPAQQAPQATPAPQAQQAQQAPQAPPTQTQTVQEAATVLVESQKTVKQKSERKCKKLLKRKCKKKGKCPTINEKISEIMAIKFDIKILQKACQSVYEAHDRMQFFYDQTFIPSHAAYLKSIQENILKQKNNTPNTYSERQNESALDICSDIIRKYKRFSQDLYQTNFDLMTKILPQKIDYFNYWKSNKSFDNIEDALEEQRDYELQMKKTSVTDNASSSVEISEMKSLSNSKNVLDGGSGFVTVPSAYPSVYPYYQPGTTIVPVQVQGPGQGQIQVQGQGQGQGQPTQPTAPQQDPYANIRATDVPRLVLNGNNQAIGILNDRQGFVPLQNQNGAIENDASSSSDSSDSDNDEDEDEDEDEQKQAEIMGKKVVFTKRQRPNTSTVNIGTLDVQERSRTHTFGDFDNLLIMMRTSALDKMSVINSKFNQTLNILERENLLADTKNIISARKKDANNWMVRITNKLSAIYNNEYTLMDIIFDTQFMVIYALKIINYGFFALSLYLAEKLFSNMYMKQVYGAGGNPPDLLIFVGLALALNLAFLIFMMTVLLLLMFIFKTPTDSFIIDNTLLYKFTIDYLAFTFIIGLSGIILGSILQKKRYFRYKTEGLRAARALNELMLSFGALTTAPPYFYLLT